jgi:hypothetical protein
MAAGQSGRRQALKIEPLLERLRRQIDWYDRKAKVNQRAYKASKISIIVLAILIPVLAEYGFAPGFEDSRGFLVGAAAGVIVLLEGLQVLNKCQKNWILYRSTCEGLRNEQHLFAERAGPLPVSSPRRRIGCSSSGPEAWSWPSTPNGRRRTSTRSRRPALFECLVRQLASESVVPHTTCGKLKLRDFGDFGWANAMLDDDKPRLTTSATKLTKSHRDRHRSPTGRRLWPWALG